MVSTRIGVAASCTPVARVSSNIAEPSPTADKTARSTVAYLIVRDQAHENAYAKALETLGVN